MNANCAFFTGRSHDICQDYAVSGIKNGQAYAIVSDGCSGSLNTDFGSRLLSLAAVKALENFKPNTEEFFLHVASVAETQALSLGLNPTSIDATLLTISAKDGQITGSVYGDGSIIVKYRHNDFIEVISSEFASEGSKEFPAYPSYMLDLKRAEAWDKINPRGILTNCYFLDTKNNNKKNDVRDPDRRNEIKYLDVRCRNQWLDIRTSIKNIEWIAILSDGIKTFSKHPVNSSIERIEAHEAIGHLMDFKGFKGSFVKRQTNWFMRSFSKKNLWDHDDDLSIACIYAGDE